MQNPQHSLTEDTTRPLTQRNAVNLTSMARFYAAFYAAFYAVVSAEKTIKKTIQKTWQGFYYFNGFYFSQ
ncbi:MAG: hypothetical protein ACJAVI_001706 [Candidatus Azotimanducaceae bacterium]|jgi:hypothetical protein